MSKTMLKNTDSIKITAVALLLAALAVASPARAETIHLKWVAAGAADRMSPVRPHSIDLSARKPADVKRLPADVTNPLYGVLTIGPAETAAHVAVLLDAPEGKPSRLFVDANGNGDFTDDPKPQWEAKPYVGNGGKHYVQNLGGMTVQAQLGATKLPLHLTLQRYDPDDPTRAGYRGAILFGPDYAREGELKLGAKSYHVMLLDAIVGGDFRGLPGGGTTGIFLLIDVNGNGLFDDRGEIYDLARPFNIGGTTYVFQGLNPSAESLELVKSPTKVAEIPPPPDLRIGKVVPPFVKKATNGATIQFPSDYKGKVVLLYFWATDCGYCTAEMPDVVKAYELFHAQGLEILGVSLDHENKELALTKFTNSLGMSWPEIYDGKWLMSDLAQLYFVQRTPTAILVDGDTGQVLASGGDLRGENLQKNLAAALTRRKK
jgi:thiol-disulfide isomerase/thioredoxin